MKKIFPLLSLVLLLASVGLSFAGCNAKENTPQVESPIFDDNSGEVRQNPENRQVREDHELIAPPIEVNLGENWMEDVHRQRAEENGIMLKESVDTSQMTINYFSVEEADTSNLEVQDDGSPLEIIDFGPTGEVPIEMLRPSVFVQFDKPMVPISKLGEPLRSSSILKLEPDTEGVYRWYGTSMLAFEPDEPLLRHALYTVRVPEGVKSLSGARLKNEKSFDFYMEEMEMLSFYFHDNENPWRGNSNIPPKALDKIFVRFNQSVDAEWLEDKIELRQGNRTISALVRQMEEGDGGSMVSAHRTLVLEPREELAVNSEVLIYLKEGSSSFEGAHPREFAQSLSFKTLMPFRFTGQSRYGRGFPTDPEGVINPVFLQFNQPLDENVLPYLETSFGSTVNLTDHVSVQYNQIRLNRLPVSYGESYTITIKAGLKDAYGQSLPEDTLVEVTVPEADSYMAAPNGYRSLEAEYQPRIIYHFQNLDTGTLSINDGETTSIIEGQTRNEANFKMVDLTPWLNEAGYGKVKLVWDYTRFYYDYRNEKHSQHRDSELIVQVTDIGITLRYGYNRLLIWANSLSTGEPISGATLEVLGAGGRKLDTRELSTDENGLVSIPLRDGLFREYFKDSRGRFIMNVAVSKGQDRADFNVRNTHSANRFGISQNNPFSAESKRQRTFFFTDRGLYKAGETVSVRGVDWIQHLGDFEVYQGSYTMRLREPGYNGDILDTVEGTCSNSGGFFLTFDLPDDLKPQYYVLEYIRGNNSRSSGPKILFQVANFRRLNFQVNVTVPNRPFYKGENISLPVEASYLAGGAMAGGTMTYAASRKPVNFVPPGEQWTDWDVGPNGWESERSLEAGEDTLDSLGSSQISLSTSEEGIEGKAYRYIVEATVEDIDRQTVSSAVSVVCHPAEWYLAAKLGTSVDGWWSRFVESGSSQDLAIALIDIDGRVPEQNRDVQVDIIRGEYKIVQQQGVADNISTRYEWVEELLETRNLTLRKGLGQLRFKPEEPGSYRLRISGTDREGRSIITDLGFYATGGRWIRWASNNDDDINMVPGKNLYFPGDTARIMVQSPLPEGKYLLTLERDGIIEEQIIQLDSSTEIIEIPIKEDYVPVVYATISSYRTRESLPASYFEPDFGKPKGYFGAVQLNISTQSRELTVEIQPNQGVYRPGEEAEVLLKVSRNGEPVADAELIFLAVDRGVLDIINYHVPNPMIHLYDRSNFPLYVNGDDSRRMLMAPVTYDVSNLIGGDGEGSKLDRRDDFSPLAVFEPILKTNSEGLAVARFTLPDTLTTYRATAIALDGNRIGYVENEVLVQNPINVRTALPRQMRIRDTAFAGCILHNLDNKSHKVNIEIESDIISIAGDRRKELELPAGAIYEVPFILEALKEGEGEILFRITSEVLNEELVENFYVERPLIKEAFSTIGMISPDDDDRKEEALLIPEKIASGYGSFSLKADSTMMPFLDSHINPLLDNHYSGISYMLYRSFPLILFPDESRGRGFFGFRKVDQRVKEMFDTLAAHQLSEGGMYFYWPQYGPSYYLSVRSALLLGLAKQENTMNRYPIDEGRLLQYLRNDYSKQGSVYIQAVSLYSQSLLGQDVTEDADALIASAGDKLGISGYGLLALAYEQMGDNRKASGLYEKIKKFTMAGTQSVDITDTWDAWDYFDSKYTQLAMIMNLSIAYDNNPAFLMKLANSLNPDRNHSHWVRNEDHIWALVALKRLSRQELGDGTDFTGKLLLNGNPLWEGDFQGEGSQPSGGDWSLWNPPLGDLPRDTLHSLMYQRNGEGSLYYSNTLKYALPSEIAPPRDEGISLVSIIETLDGEEVTDNELVLGDTYRMRVVLSTRKDRSYVQLSVPVPSGADIVDPSFSSSSRFISSGGVMEESWTRNTGYGDEQSFVGEGYADLYEWYFYWIRPKTFIYDNRLDYCWENIYKGQREVSFLFRATTPGVYPTPPAQALLEYEPEVFGRTAGRLYVIR